ncbi:MAG: LD-carboxypeptidase [Lentisphaeria bacterium]|nr:LD-carboxypeptidase [Lentisphaeria bacterium]
MNNHSCPTGPHKIRKGDLFPDWINSLGLAAPSGAVSPDRYHAACRFLTGLGIRLVVGKSVLKGDRLSYVSAPAEDRADDFNELIRNPEIQAVYCLRGGYGSVHLLDRIDWRTLQRRKLPVVGYSDITALHAAMEKEHAGVAVSACMALNLENDARNATFRRNFKRVWDVAGVSQGKFRKIARLKPCGKRNSLPEAPLFCGNLTTLASLCGTKYLAAMTGKIVFLEDIAEPVRKLDRTLMQLKLSGFFEGCAGLVFGNFKQCGNPAEREELFTRFAASMRTPVFSGLHFGHCACSVSLICGETAVVRDGNLYLRDPFSA